MNLQTLQVFLKLLNIFLEFHDRHPGGSTTLEKCLGTPGTPGVFEKSCKNIFKLDIHSGGSTTSEKCLGTPGTPGVF